jgi:hypothetical protein
MVSLQCEKLNRLKNNIFYFKMELSSIQKKLMKHKYVITIDGTNKTYYGTCQCPDSYLFSDVVKFESTHK